MAALTLPVETKQIFLVNQPSGLPVLSGPDATFEVRSTPLPELKEGELVRRLGVPQRFLGPQG
jgi:hypothetical protein